MIAFGTPVGRVHQQEQANLRRQPLLVVVDIVADDLDAGEVDRRAEGAAQHVEMPVHGLVGHQMHARLDDGLAASLRRETLLDRGDDLIVRQRQRLDVERVEIGQIERGHGAPGAEADDRQLLRSELNICVLDDFCPARGICRDHGGELGRRVADRFRAL